jgi:hypothetical protein
MPHLGGCRERGLLVIEGENVSWKFGKMCIDSKDLGKGLIIFKGRTMLLLQHSFV